mgnify:CR=1 FL=1
MFTGFVFSRDEPTALVQKAGGPCAVIAPMQAFVLKYVNSVNHMKTVSFLYLYLNYAINHIQTLKIR